MIENLIENKYVNYLYDSMVNNNLAEGISYLKLFKYLYSVDFIGDGKDKNRAEDGLALRREFVKSMNMPENAIKNTIGKRKECSVLEMMIALAVSMENIAENSLYGDRTRQWFWGMIVSLGLGPMTDDWFTKDEVKKIITNFLNKEYSSNGGGLFIIHNSTENLTEMEIWYQMCRYLDSMAL